MILATPIKTRFPTASDNNFNLTSSSTAVHSKARSPQAVASVTISGPRPLSERLFHLSCGTSSSCKKNLGAPRIPTGISRVVLRIAARPYQALSLFLCPPTFPRLSSCKSTLLSPQPRVRSLLAVSLALPAQVVYPAAT